MSVCVSVHVCVIYVYNSSAIYCIKMALYSQSNYQHLHNMKKQNIVWKIKKFSYQLKWQISKE